MGEYVKGYVLGRSVFLRGIVIGLILLIIGIISQLFILLPNYTSSLIIGLGAGIILFLLEVRLNTKSKNKNSL